MGVRDGAVVSTTQIVNNGSPSDRWNLVIAGDGYQYAELPQFATNAQDAVNALFATPPFNNFGILAPPLKDAINVYRVDVSSTDSGADDPIECGGTGSPAATYFDSSFCNSGIQRLLMTDTENVVQTVNAAVPYTNGAILVLVNSTVYGGSGGTVATCSLHPQAFELALHELGHTAFGLADEYEYYAGCGVDADRDTHEATDPSEVNVTTVLSPLKWSSLVKGTAIPTTTNADHSVCDPQANPVGSTTVGAFEGAHYYHGGAWRPQYNCKMRALGYDFCAVCQQQIRHVLAPFRPRLAISETLERLESYLAVRFSPLEVLDEALFDLDRITRITRAIQTRSSGEFENQLRTLMAQVESMGETDLRTTLLRVRQEIGRLEGVAAALESGLKKKL
jgi:hypothetical protein